MFVQMVQGKAKDVAAIEASMQRWIQDLKPRAKGWLGATTGITTQGEFVAVVRFDTEQNARANSDSAEQTAWWNEFSKNLDGDASFFDSTEVEEFGAGGSDDAGFVQIITGNGKDKNRLKQIDKEMDAATETQRPDVIGGINAWSGDRFVQVIYFTSEKEARANEAKGFEGDAKALMEEMQAITDDVRFLDINEPKMFGP